MESWCEASLPLALDKEPEEVILGGDGSAGAGGASSGAGAGGPVVRGLRYRLAPLDLDSTRPLPANGKVSGRSVSTCVFTTLSTCARVLRPPCGVLAVMLCVWLADGGGGRDREGCVAQGALRGRACSPSEGGPVCCCCMTAQCNVGTSGVPARMGSLRPDQR